MTTYTAVLKNQEILLNDGYNGDQRFLNLCGFEFQPGVVYECNVAMAPLMLSINCPIAVGYAVEETQAPDEDPSDVFVLLNDKLHLMTSAGQIWLVTNPSEDIKLYTKCHASFRQLSSGPAIFNGERIEVMRVSYNDQDFNDKNS